MKSRHVLGGGFLLAGVLLTGTPTEAADTVTPCGADYDCMRDLMFHYRSQAIDLKMMAERYEREADFKAKELGWNSSEVKNSREMAKNYWKRAQEADQLARDYQYQLPHNAY